MSCHHRVIICPEQTQRRASEQKNYLKRIESDDSGHPLSVIEVSSLDPESPLQAVEQDQVVRRMIASE
jgi:hypothetical protein